MERSYRIRPLRWDFLPFACAAVLAWIAVPIGSTVDWRQYANSVALLALSGALLAVANSGRRAWWLSVVSNSYIFLLAIALLRNSAGGFTSAVGGLALIPVFHTALYSRSKRDLSLVLAGVAVFYVAPIMIFGAPAYPGSQYRAGLLAVMVSAIIGFATQRLVADVRHQAGEARNRERMLEQVAATLRGLFASSKPRADVCEAIRQIGNASLAVLYEPVPKTGALRSSAMAGIELEPIEVAVGQPCALRDAFVSGQPLLVNDNIAGHLASPRTWEAAGRPESLLYQPVLEEDKPVGVLVVGWHGEKAVDRSRVTIVELLAHEAAAVIERADALQRLAGMAQTDALTGLPNRRAWDLRLKQATADDRELTVSILDFDHFKEFNDSYGHPAGDRLLKETSAVWRDKLRAEDLLARLGGEEFGLLLLDTDRSTSELVIERLRAAVPMECTCSAGVAVRGPGEPVEAVIARADRALYDAKGAGRDRLCVST